MGIKKATTALFIDRYHPKADGTCAVSVRVTYDRKKRYYATPYALKPDFFDKTQGAKPRGDFKEIGMLLHAYEKKAVTVIDSLPVFTWDAFERLYLSNRGSGNGLNDAFTDYIGELRGAGRIGTAVSYECARKSLDEFSSNAKFADVTPAFLRKYEAWMLDKGNSFTTIGIYLRSLRTILNMAIEDGMLTKEMYPFGRKRYEIPTGRNVKKALSLQDIGRIFSYQAEPGSIREKCRDYWVFIYLCNGLNVKDFCRLQFKNIDGDFLQFVRAKTARTKRDVEPIRIALNDHSRGIIEKWGNSPKDGETFIFPELTKGLSPERERELIQNLTGLINDHMKAIARELDINTPITTYTARHSFATILQRSGASISFISGALGHGSTATTQNYLAGFEDDSIKETAKALTAFFKPENLN